MNILDIETEGWDTFVAGGLKTYDGIYISFDEQAFIRRVLTLPAGAVVWAHNGGRYDVLWVLEAAAKYYPGREAILTVAGGTVISCRFPGGPVIRDSFRLLPVALSKAGELCGVPKRATGLPCRCGHNCGGYCSIRQNMTKREKDLLSEYLRGDLETLAACLGRLQYIAARAGLPDPLACGTIGAVAWRAVRDIVGSAYWPDARTYEAARAGYYGGRVEVARTFAKRVWRYDRNSSYPAALTEPVPVGRPRFLSGPDADAAVRRYTPGIYTATVCVGEDQAPLLPARVGGRVVYPTGAFTGTWAAPELLISNEPFRVHCGIVWEREEPVYREWIRSIWSARASAAAAGDGLASLWLKLVANALSGRLALRPCMDIVRFGSEPAEPGWEPVAGSPIVWRRRGGRYDLRGSRHVHHAAYCTALARLALHAKIRAAGSDWVYSDTDSVYSARDMGPGEDGLGQWKLEGVDGPFRAVAPKVYHVGSKHFRVKGVPVRSAADWDAYVSGRGVEMRGVYGLLSAGPDLFRRRDCRRAFRGRPGWIGGRILEPDGISTRAPTYEEALDEFGRESAVSV